MTEEDKNDILSNDSTVENELLSQYSESYIQGLNNKELPAKKSEDDVFSHSHPVVTKKKDEFNLVKKIKSKELQIRKSGIQSRSAFSTSLDSINSIIEKENWIPKVLYVVKLKDSDNSFEVASASFLSNKLKPPIPSEWGTEKTELPESERLKNLNTLLHSEPNSIPPSEKKKKIQRRPKVKDYNNQPVKASFAYDTSFDPEKEFLELNSRYPPSSSKNLEKSLKSKDIAIKQENADIEFLIEPNKEILSNSSTESFLISPEDYSTSENKIIIRNSKKKHNFQEKPIVHISNPFLQIGEKRVSKPYKPYLPVRSTPTSKKKSPDQHKIREKEEIFEPQPGTSKMESDYESLSSDASELETEKRCNHSSLKIDKPFSDFSLQGMRLKTLGNKIEPHKSTKVKISEPVKEKLEYSPFSSTSGSQFEIKSIEDNLHLEGENVNKIKTSNDQDFTVKEVQLEKSLKAFSERKEDNQDNYGENNVNEEEEEEEHLVFSWSSSDLGISRWSLPSRATSVSNSIVDRLSVNYVLNSVVKRFIDVRQLAPLTYSQRPARNLREYNQQLGSQEAGASHQM